LLIATALIGFVAPDGRAFLVGALWRKAIIRERR
jgi:hypothetical protein